MLQFSLTKQVRRSYQPKKLDCVKYIRASLIKKYSFISLNIIIVTSQSSQELNQKYRDQNKPTNVISLEYSDNNNEFTTILTGDLILCDDVIVREALEQNKSNKDHYAHMIVHGVLHLQGLDHIKLQDAKNMEKLEIDILARLGFTNPYNQQI